MGSLRQKMRQCEHKQPRILPQQAPMLRTQFAARRRQKAVATHIYPAVRKKLLMPASPRTKHFSNRARNLASRTLDTRRATRTTNRQLVKKQKRQPHSKTLRQTQARKHRRLRARRSKVLSNCNRFKMHGKVRWAELSATP